MRPVLQTRLHSEVAAGNCFRACLASLLERPIEEVPAFEDMTVPYSWQRAFLDYLESVGFAYEGFCTDPLLLGSYDGVDGYCIVDGPSPRGEVNHAVVYHRGHMEHDPHPSGLGILGVRGFYMIERAGGDEVGERACQAEWQG